MGQFKLSDFLSDGTGKRPFFVTEQFAFDEIGRQSGAIDLDKRLIEHDGCYSADRVGHQLLAGTAFPPDQHIGLLWQTWEII